MIFYRHQAAYNSYGYGIIIDRKFRTEFLPLFICTIMKPIQIKPQWYYIEFIMRCDFKLLYQLIFLLITNGNNGVALPGQVTFCIYKYFTLDGVKIRMENMSMEGVQYDRYFRRRSS